VPLRINLNMKSLFMNKYIGRTNYLVLLINILVIIYYMNFLKYGTNGVVLIMH